MRFFNKYAYMGAIALVGAVGFTACSSDDDLTAPQNPTFDGESVKTQFAINIPYAGGKDTRMSEDATQGDGASASFNGMQSIYLLPLTATGSGASTFNSIIPLPAFTGFEVGSSNYKLYNDVNVPVGTTHFLFYGIGGQTIPSDASGKFANGILNSTLPTTASAGDVKFNLERILTGTEFRTPQTKLLDVLNNVAKANIDEGTKKWSHQLAGTDLGDLYASYTTLKGGSANSIKLTMEELYNAVNGLATAAAESDEKNIAKAIQGAIDDYFTVNGNAAPYTLTWNISDPSNIASYPTNLNVPEGAAQVKWNDGKSAFEYVTNATVGASDKTLNVYNLCYPASLAYFVNTPLKATTEKNVTWPNTAINWKNEQWTGWDDAVDASTQTVALKDNIQYGVANLNTTVTCKTSTLEDNASEIAKNKYSANQHIVVPKDGFKVTGLLVGGQPDFASWDMTPFDNNFTMTVYDNSLTDIYAKYNAVSNKNYTLLLDNTATDHKTVNIALELENNSGSDFYGVDGKIANGAKFYLVAQLNPTAGTGVTQPGGTTLNDVFVQDYVTTANLTITSLKNAYVTIPDLRASELVLGLSVDLTWETGLKFDVDIE